MDLNLTEYSPAKEITISWTLWSPSYLEFSALACPLCRCLKWIEVAHPTKGQKAPDGSFALFCSVCLLCCSLPCDLNRLSDSTPQSGPCWSFESHRAWTICPPWSAVYPQRNIIVTSINAHHHQREHHEQQHHSLSVCGIRSVPASSIWT